MPDYYRGYAQTLHSHYLASCIEGARGKTFAKSKFFLSVIAEPYLMADSSQLLQRSLQIRWKG
jgi:hypothetical protein